jgi:hypothetical protein
MAHTDVKDATANDSVEHAETGGRYRWSSLIIAAVVAALVIVGLFLFLDSGDRKSASNRPDDTMGRSDRAPKDTPKSSPSATPPRDPWNP